MDGVKIITLAVYLNLILATRTFAGPPFLTDDPGPTDYQHWENYLFATGDHENGHYTIYGPALEINYGVLPDTQLSLSVPLTTIGGGGAPTVSGLGDVQLGLKYRSIPPSPYPRVTPLVVWATVGPGFNFLSGCKRVGGHGRLTAAGVWP